MSSSSEKTYLVDVSEFTLQIVRASGRTIEVYHECLLDDRPAIEQALASVAGKANPIPVLAAVSPKARFAHRANDDEAKSLRSAEVIAAHAATRNFNVAPPFVTTVCGVEEGRPVAAQGQAKWLLVGAGETSIKEAITYLAGFNVKPSLVSPAVTGHLGAVTTAVQAEANGGPVVVWDLGETHSWLFLVGARGVIAAQPSPVGTAQVFEAIQSELGLRFRAAAGKLFVNTSFDFSEAGPKIGVRLASALQPALGGLPEKPVSLHCLGVPGTSAWLARDVAGALGLKAWQPDVLSLGRLLGFELAPNQSSHIASTAAGLLHWAAGLAGKTNVWHPEWPLLGGSAAAPRSAAPAPASPSPATVPLTIATGAEPPRPAKAVAAAEPEKRNGQSVSAGLTATASGTVVPVQATAVLDAPTAGASTGPAPKALASPPATAPEKGRTTTKSEPAPSAAPRAAAPSAAATAPAKAPTVAPVKAPTPPAPPARSPVAAAPAAEAEQPAKKKSMVPVIVGVAVLVLGAGGYFFVGARNEASQAEQRRLEAEKVAQAALAKAQAVEENAKREAERIRREADADRERAVALAKKQAEEQAQVREAERVARAPGILIITTEPTGASVSIDGGAPRFSPLSLNDLSPGQHRIVISMPGYHAEIRNVDIKGGQTVDPGLIQLRRQTGVLEIGSAAPGVKYEIRPIGTPSAPPLRTGETPATLSDLPVGEYTLRFLAEGFSPISENVTVFATEPTKVVPAYTTGRVVISSTPAGATVYRDGRALGSTPLALNDLYPGEVIFELALPSHDRAKIAARIEPGISRSLEATLDRTDRLAKMSDLAQPPTPLSQVAPEMTDIAGTHETIISCIVDREGVPQNLRVERTSDNEFANRCITALGRWRFAPGILQNGKPVNVRVTVPFRTGMRTTP